MLVCVVYKMMFFLHHYLYLSESVLRLWSVTIHRRRRRRRRRMETHRLAVRGNSRVRRGAFIEIVGRARKSSHRTSDTLQIGIGGRGVLTLLSPPVRRSLAELSRARL